VKSHPAAYTTDALPPQRQPVRMAMTFHAGKPSATGYYLIEGAGPDVFAVDGEGTIRWYKQFDTFAAETKQQADGTFTTFVGNTMGFQPYAGEYERYTPGGERIATYAARSPDISVGGKPPVYTDNHDLVISKDAEGTEHIHLIGYELLPLSPTDSTIAAWHMVQRQSTSGVLEMRWKASSRFTSDDTIETIAASKPDVDHMNALSLDPNDDNYVVSLRNLDAVVKIEQASGKVLWQIGGKQATIKVENDPLGGFNGQHDAQIIQNGDLLVFDDGTEHSPPES